MKYSPWLSLFPLATLGCLIPLTVKAQVTPDGTTSTTVNQNGNNFTIEQGDRINDNLFHSFNEFSVPTGGSAAFNNAGDIANIFSRVTGSNISSIDGLLSANGAANLYLINPNGIIFGQNARLDLGGSFFASTADSLLFEGNAEFSAVNPQAAPLLEVSIPTGARFRDNPGEIVNGSSIENEAGEFVGLEVDLGKNLSLIGGDISFEAGKVTAKGGRIELGGLSEAGTVTIEPDSSLTFPEGVARANVSFANDADVDVRSEGGGSISVNASNIELLGGEFGDSQLRAGILSSSTDPNAQAGDIVLNASNAVTLDDSANIANNVNFGAIGNSGGIEINTGSLTVQNASQISSQVFGTGNSGDININAQGKVSFDGRDETDSFPSAIFTSVELTGEGNGGNININAESLEITNRAQLLSNIRGMGDGGDINIQVLDEVRLANSILISEVTAPDENGEGGRGDAGDINITAGSLLLQDGSALLADTENIGNAGNINIKTQEQVVLEGEGFSAFTNSTDIVASQITATVDDFEGVIGQGGNIDISTPSLTLRDGGLISARTFGQGNAGNLTINTERLLLEGGQLNTITFGDGDAGNLIIRASESLEIFGTSVDSGSSTGIFASAIGGTGNGGNLTITTEQLTIRDQALVSVSNFQSQNLIPPGSGAAGTLNIEASSIQLNNEGTITAANANGIGGTLTINADSLSLDNRSSIEAFSTSEIGKGGIINLNLDNSLFLRNNSEISARADNRATGGTINLNADFIITFPNENSDIIASAVEGQGGNIDITAESLFGIEERPLDPLTNDINASSQFSIDGNIVINTPEVDPTSGLIELPQAVGDASDQISQNPCEQGVGSEFTITGKGGLPPNVNESLNSESAQVGLIETVPSQQQKVGANNISSDNSIPEATPAMGWVFNDKGEVTLTAYSNTDTEIKRSPQAIPDSCSAPKNK